MGVKVKKRKYLEDRPAWEQSYWQVTDQHEADAGNPQIEEAWEQYYMMKSLLVK